MPIYDLTKSNNTQEAVERQKPKTGDHDHIIVMCVYRTGPGYNWDYVFRLYSSLKRHLKMPFMFACLTNDNKSRDASVARSMGIKIVALTNDWPGWWSKLELFRPFKFERALYFDLDTIICGDITELATYGGDFAMLSNFAHPERCGSGVMAWRPDAAKGLYHKFKGAADLVMDELKSKGDQTFIEKFAPQPIDRLQDFVPGQIESWKLGKITDNTRVVCFHGTPKPHEVKNNPFVKKHWWGE